jgi:hypothetical protein
MVLQMPETVPPPSEAERTAADADDVFSPELALVDPELRDRLAAQPAVPVLAPKPEPDPEPDPEPEPEPASPVAEATEPLLPPPVGAAAPEAVPSGRPRRRAWPLAAAALVGAALAVAATSLFSPFNGTTTTTQALQPTVPRIGPPASSTVTDPTRTTATTPRGTTTPRSTKTGATTSPAHVPPPASTHPSTTPKPPKPKPAPPVVTRQEFAWAPAPGATAYDVALFAKTKRIFHARTRRARITIAVRTGKRGPAGSVPAGAYEWYVWPIVNGRQATAAIVRSRLNLSD